MKPTLIRNVRILDPLPGRDETGDVYMEGGVFAEPPDALPEGCEVIDGSGLAAAPGLWDIHVHLREPGGEAAETVASGSHAAAHGGFTTIVAMPNTRPALDRPELVAQVLEAGRVAGHARVWTSACLTRGREGREPAPLAELAAAGAVAFTDDGCTVQDDALMRRVMEAARDLDRLVMDHAQDRVMEAAGVMHEGTWSRRFELPGIPSQAETRIVRRDANLAEQTGCRVHIQHITAGETVPILAEARARGVHITGEATPHHLTLADEDIDPADANYKMNPPLRSAADRDALNDAIVAGDIEIFATDHAPHPAEAKAKGFLQAPFGVLGLETAVGLTYRRLVRNGRLTPLAWLHRWTVGPARVLGVPPPSLAPGQRADLVLLDLHADWVIDAGDSLSRSRNTPFHGTPASARATRTFLAGATTWRAP
jgi:dihydroorotase